MLGLLRDVAPRALVAGAALWGAANYLFIGPGIGARIVNVDHLPVCERNHEAMILAAARGPCRRSTIALRRSRQGDGHGLVAANHGQPAHEEPGGDGRRT
jgi:hypothetical protein